MAAQAPPSLPDQRRASLRSGFAAQVAAGAMRPLVLPYSVLGTFVLPMLYLSVPHGRRPWLARARFAVLAAVAALNLRMMAHTSSANMAGAYAAGLLGTWGVVWNAALLVWMRPQSGSARVERRTRGRGRGRAREQDSDGGPESLTNGKASGYDHTSGKAPDEEEKTKRNQKRLAPDESVAAVIDEFEYYWQSFPEDASWLTRLDWAFDLCTAFRGAGWTHSISAIPHFAPPTRLSGSEAVDLASIPLSTRAGYSRETTYRSFLRSRLLALGVNYLALDMVGVSMMHDPYFVFGPAYTDLGHALPPRLASMSPWLLKALRSGQTLVGVYSALVAIFTLDQLVRVFVLGRLLPGYGARADLWQYASIFGSFGAILDQGLAGFWGTWWHQTFRLAFVAPTAWLVANGHLRRGTALARAVGGLVAFAQSGFLHAGGSLTTLPPSHFWMPPLFFLLSWLGILLQTWLATTLLSRCSSRAVAAHPLPRPLRRAGNLAFVVLWLHLTGWPFLDDLARAAIWLLEPVPFSPCRVLGLGHPGDAWWRWDGAYVPSWYSGPTWWETGVGL